MKWLIEILSKNKRISLDEFIAKEGDSFPLLYQLALTQQDKEWHGEGDVHIHTNMVLNEMFNIIEKERDSLSIDDKLILILSAIFHDIAKPLSTKTVDVENVERVVSPRHAEMGASYLQYRLDVESETIKQSIIDIVMHHHDVRKAVQGNSFESELLYITRNVSGKLLYLLEIADIKGRICPDKDMLLFELEIFKEYAIDNNCFYVKSNFDKELLNYLINDGVNVELDSEIFLRTKYDLLNGLITDPHVGVIKHYGQKNSPVGIILVGLSGSGKSTLAKKISNEKDITNIISADKLRNGDKKIDRKEAYRKMLEEVKSCLRRRESFIVDATNIREDSRDKIHNIITQYGGLTYIRHIQTTIDECIFNDHKRDLDSKVGRDVILEQRNGFQIVKRKKYHNVEFI